MVYPKKKKCYAHKSLEYDQASLCSGVGTKNVLIVWVQIFLFFFKFIYIVYLYINNRLTNFSLKNKLTLTNGIILSIINSVKMYRSQLDRHYNLEKINNIPSKLILLFIYYYYISPT